MHYPLVTESGSTSEGLKIGRRDKFRARVRYPSIGDVTPETSWPGPPGNQSSHARYFVGDIHRSDPGAETSGTSLRFIVAMLSFFAISPRLRWTLRGIRTQPFS